VAGQAPPHGGGKGGDAELYEAEAANLAESEAKEGSELNETFDKWNVKLKLTGPGGLILEVPSPANMAEQIGAYVAEQVKRLLG
jgi:hypothetical protein